MSDIVVRGLTPDLLEEWLYFFDHDGFADNPDWSGCYCYFQHADHVARDWDSRSGSENRAAACDLIAAGRMKGYLAYDGERPVGWVHAAPRLLIPNLQLDASIAVDDADRVGSVVCFVIAAPHRRRGIARALLAAACDGFQAQGLAVAEAYPRTRAQGDGPNYHGPMRLYMSAGFTHFRACEGLVMVRRALAPAG
jgi:GNAT superfamily N-acetyltransferase